MGKCCTLFFFISLVGIGFIGYKVTTSLNEVPEVPKFENTWWGPRDRAKENNEIKPFKIQVSDEVLKDLKHRLDIAKPFYPALEGVNHEYGINSKLLEEIITYWKTKYNWREREKFLNKYPQFTVSVQGLRIHYLHIKPTNTQGKKVLPLLLLHGWPGSVREFYEAIPHLIKPQKNYVFELIIPSLPGYGFSEAAVRPGLGVLQLSILFKNFMERLGFKKYYIQGGDWGAGIVQNMAAFFPENILGVHSNMCIANSPKGNLLLILGSFYPSLVATEEESALMYPLSEKYGYLVLESGYMHIQATKPDTVGAALRETPVGLAAYILEKFTTWTNPNYKTRLDGGLLERYNYDKLLDNVMIYWISDSIVSSMRLYSESLNSEQLSTGLEKIPITVPSGCARFKYELMYHSETLLKQKFTNLVHLKDHVGGHFAAFEVPEILANDIVEFVTKVETTPKTVPKQEL